jgi:hypothetical protein
MAAFSGKNKECYIRNDLVTDQANFSQYVEHLGFPEKF